MFALVICFVTYWTDGDTAIVIAIAYTNSADEILNIQLSVIWSGI